MTTSSDSPSTELGTHKAPHQDYRHLDREKLTPMFQHYTEVKEQNPGALLLYRVGDFFECFFQDSVIISRELELILTSKEGGKEIGRVAMTGVPHHALERYARVLVEKGYSVAICDQVEDAAYELGTEKAALPEPREGRAAAGRAETHARQAGQQSQVEAADVNPQQVVK